MTIRNRTTRLLLDAIMLVVVGVLFIIPFVFIFFTASKSQSEAALFQFSLPTEFRLIQNLEEVLRFRDSRIILALWNSTLLTVGSVVLIVTLGASAAFVIQRRHDRVASLVSTLLFTGLVLPPSVVPTIFVLQEIGLYRSLVGLILVEVAIQLPFAVLILRAFMASIPREIDEAAIIDGASPWQLFRYVVLPILRPAIITVVVVSAVIIYNDFTLPLYFLPGVENVTAQITLFSFISQFSSRWDLLFANVIIITIPPLVMYIFFQKQIVAGLTSGAVKG
jgi:raffinose/stachyose/melibiose transport system permease protein